ncbi:MAG TPA: hypothetical protein VHS97_25155 [Isosphaeraceae bacterium]|nr:hypothetical protein [Isosphaeraceae bacterium]
MIPKYASIRALAVVASGALLGGTAATADLPRSAVPSKQEAAGGAILVGKAADAAKTCCSSDLARGSLLALAEHNQSVAANAAQAGKNPNFRSYSARISARRMSAPIR